MYSPKIREDLIPLIYQIKQARDGKPMTKIVDEILRPAVFATLSRKTSEAPVVGERSEQFTS
jgi:hypothetical protein